MGRLYLTLHCHRQNDSALRRAGSGESRRFNVSMNCEGQSPKLDKCPQSTTSEERGILKRNYKSNRGPSVFQPLPLRPNRLTFRLDSVLLKRF